MLVRREILWPAQTLVMLRLMLTADQTKLDLLARLTPNKSTVLVFLGQVTVCTAQRTVFEDRDSTHEMKRIR
jgi:hypothetical protein